MRNIGAVIDLLETFRDRDMWIEGFMTHEDKPKTRKNICGYAIETIIAQQAEIERLKGELKAECKNAEHDAYGCLGYGKSSQDDELTKKCKNCEKYTGNIASAENH